MLNNTLFKLNKKILKNVICNVFLRNYGNSLVKEYNISQFCTVNINCPYNINIKPIDVFQNQDRVLISYYCDNLKLPDIKCEKKDDTISINVAANNTSKSYTLNVEAPVKANLGICGLDGNINIGSFYGKFIEVKSHNGHIDLSKSQCENIFLMTNNGNIACKDVIQAGDIVMETKGSGKISTDRLQGLRLKAFTESGPMNIGSSYCDNSIFETNSGNLTLQSIHKRVTINIKHEALLTIVGLDGELFLHMKKGLANVQLAKILKDSIINIEDPSSLILKLSDDCQQNNIVEILSKDYILSKTITMNSKQNIDSCVLFPHTENTTFSKLEVKCKNSHVFVDSISWPELLTGLLKKTV